MLSGQQSNMAGDISNGIAWITTGILMKGKKDEGWEINKRYRNCGVDDDRH